MELPPENVVQEIKQEVKSVERGCFQRAQEVMDTAPVNTTHQQWSCSPGKKNHPSAVAAHKSGREEGGKGEEKREDPKEEIAEGRRDGERRLSLSGSEVEPPVGSLNCAINSCARQGRKHLIRNLPF